MGKIENYSIEKNLVNLKLSHKEIKSREEAILYGKGRGWCTGKLGNTYYDSDYNISLGRLFVIFKDPNPRAQYQIFFSRRGGVELRKKFNAYMDPDEFFTGKGISLLDWYTATKKSVFIPGDYEQSFFDRVSHRDYQLTGTVSLSASQQIGRTIRGFSHNVLRSIEESLSNQEIERFNFSHRWHFKIHLKSKEQDVIRIHRKEEMPEARQTRPGQIFYVQEGDITLLRVSVRGIPTYLVSNRTRYITDCEEFMPGSVNNPITVNFDDRKILLSFHLGMEYKACLEDITIIDEVNRTGQFEETIKCHIYREQMPRSIHY